VADGPVEKAFALRSYQAFAHWRRADSKMVGNLIEDNGFPEAEAKVNKHLFQPMINASMIGTFTDGI
jgi:hypothetical protein